MNSIGAGGLEASWKTKGLSEIAFRHFTGKFVNLKANRYYRIWREAYRQARSELIKRLVVSFLFERLVPFKEIEPRLLSDMLADSIPSMPQIVYQIGHKGNRIFIPVKCQTQFARMTPFSYLLHQTREGDILKLEDPIAFFDAAIATIDRFVPQPEKVRQTRSGIQNSFENLACGICFKLIQRELKTEDQNGKYTRANALIHYEQLVTTGHPVHPLTKLRSNISLEETLRIAPEYNSSIDIGFVAVKKEHFHCTCLDSVNFQQWLEPEIRRSLVQKMPQISKPDNFCFIPVHIWQYLNWLKPIFKDDIKEKRIIPLGHSFIKAAPCLSLRTLYIDSPDMDFFLKLPVNMQTTSYFRTVSPNATQNGVALSRIFRSISDRHRVFREKTSFLLETEGAFYSTKPADQMLPEDIAVSKHLGYIVRQSPYGIIGSDEIPIVTVALVDHNRLTHRPVIHELISLHSEITGAETIQQGALSWFEAFLDVSIEGLLTLLSVYGIGFEAHMQNTITVVSQATGTPTRLLLRDFGGIRISMNRLRKMGFSTDFFPMSVTIKDSMEEVRNKLFYAFFQSVLGELVAELAQAYSIGEFDLWKMAYLKSREVFAKLKNQHPFPDWVDTDFAYFVRQHWSFKSLLSMSLIDSDSDYVYTDISNPFCMIHQAQ